MKSTQGLRHVKDFIFERMDEIGRRKASQGVTGIPTGYVDLDRLTAGWQPGTLVILAARPSMGKTSFAAQSGAYSAEKGKKVALFSLEMSKESLAEKLLCNLGMVDGHKMRVGGLQDKDWEVITQVAKQLYYSGLHIDDSKRLTALDIKAICRRMQQESGLDLVIIDYLQLITPHSKKQSMTYEVGEITKELKNMAAELKVPVICLSQLSRQCEQRGRDKRPILSDLRDSGSIEADADLVLFLYRDEYYDPESEKKGITEVNIAKQREGPTGMVELGFFKEFTRFVNLAVKG
jgi:replicative DNA helicase